MQRVDVWSTKRHVRGEPVHQDLAFQAREDLMPESVSSNRWFQLPLTGALGVPLHYAKTKVQDIDTKNNFALIMSFWREPLSEEKGWDIENPPICGAIMVMRTDGHQLQPQDIEALAEFVGTELPYLEPRSCGRERRSKQIDSTNKKWDAVGNKERFAEWWYEWRDQKVGDGRNDGDGVYAGLQCPVVGAVRPSSSKWKQAKKKAANLKEETCVLQ